MSNQEQTAVILNPRAAHGRAGRDWPSFEGPIRALLGEFTLFTTQGRGHATELATTAMEHGYTHIISVGGDGTHHEVINGFLGGRQRHIENARLSLIPRGTGADFGRTLGLPKGRDALRHLASTEVMHVDVGRVTYTGTDGATVSRYFFNMADFGFGGVVAQRVNETSKFFGGFASFLYGVLRSLADFATPSVRLVIDDEILEGPMLNTFIANARYCGGGMHVAPEARLDDGLFDVYVLGEFGRFEAVRNLPLLYRGQLMKRADKIKYFRARRITASCEKPVLLNLDGEQPGQLPVSIEMVPGALPLTLPLKED
jgi:diacylglycerol kinase (ATP)